jgi:transcriptional regulator with XRE-family HTH domain
VDEVRRLRLEKGWSQNELAYHAKLAPSVISLIETGKRNPNATTLRKLADALDVQIPDLFEESGSGKARRRSSPEPSLFNGFEEERHDYESQVWERINLLDRAADQWQQFLDEGRYDLKTLDLEDLKVVDAVSLHVVINHARDAARIKRTSTDEQRTRLEQAERRLIDTNLEFWARVESALERTTATDHDELEAKRALKAQRAQWEPVLRNSRTA